MSIGTVVTRGFAITGASIAAVVLRGYEAAAASSASYADTHDPLFAEWWRRKRASEKARGRLMEAATAKAETSAAEEPVARARPKVVALPQLSPQTLERADDVETLGELRQLAQTLAAAERRLIMAAIAEFERQAEEEEEIEMLILALT